MNSELLTIKEVAQTLRLSRAYCYVLVKSAILPSVWIGRKRLVRRATLEHVLKNGLPNVSYREARAIRGR